jgi:hypothetical protein
MIPRQPGSSGVRKRPYVECRRKPAGLSGIVKTTRMIRKYASSWRRTKKFPGNPDRSVAKAHVPFFHRAYTGFSDVETAMTEDDVVQLFRKSAETLVNDYPACDTIMQLAKLLSESKGRMSKDHFEALVHIGAILYKQGLSEFRARSEVAATMKDSVGNEAKR